jgi:hypothetical protein
MISSLSLWKVVVIIFGRSRFAHDKGVAERWDEMQPQTAAQSACPNTMLRRIAIAFAVQD